MFKFLTLLVSEGVLNVELKTKVEVDENGAAMDGTRYKLFDLSEGLNTWEKYSR